MDTLFLQGIYTYIINNIPDNQIKELWKLLKEYTENGSYTDYNEEDNKRFNNLISELNSLYNEY